MTCPYCHSARLQAVPVFRSKWYAANIIEQSTEFVCLDCGSQFAPGEQPPPPAQPFNPADFLKGIVLLGLLIWGLAYGFVACAGRMEKSRCLAEIADYRDGRSWVSPSFECDKYR